MLTDGNIERLDKKLDPAVAYGEFLGIFYISALAVGSVRSRVRRMMHTGYKNSYLFDMVNALIAEDLKLVTPFEVNKLKWEEIDFMEDVERATARFS